MMYTSTSGDWVSMASSAPLSSPSIITGAASGCSTAYFSTAASIHSSLEKPMTFNRLPSSRRAEGSSTATLVCMATA